MITRSVEIEDMGSLLAYRRQQVAGFRTCRFAEGRESEGRQERSLEKEHTLGRLERRENFLSRDFKG